MERKRKFCIFVKIVKRERERKRERKKERKKEGERESEIVWIWRGESFG